MLSLAAQKFVSDIAADAYQHARIRTNAAGGGRGRAGAAKVNFTKDRSSALVSLCSTPFFLQDKTKTTLTMDDLSAALGEYNINAKKPEFFM